MKFNVNMTMQANFSIESTYSENENSTKMQKSIRTKFFDRNVGHFKRYTNQENYIIPDLSILAMHFAKIIWSIGNFLNIPKSYPN